MNDPVAVILVIGFVEWLQNDDYGIADMALLFVQELAIGAVVGALVGLAASRALHRLTLGSAGLYPVASLAAAALAYGGADAAHGSGFLAVYLCGLALGSSEIPARRTIVTVPRGPRVGRAARDVPHARPARVPGEARRRGARGNRRGTGGGGGRAPARRTDRAPEASRCARGWCSAGRACAGRSPSCWRRSL